MNLYLTAILPPALLAEEIDDIRKEIAEKYKVVAALKPPVHITLYKPLRLDLESERQLIKSLKPVAGAHKPFVQALENFDSFNNKTLFVNCPKQPLLNNLQKDIAAVYYRHHFDIQEVKSNNRFHPHITIAYRDVKPETFIPLWEEFKNRKFKRSFTVNQFTLLKHDGKKWLPLENFPINKPEELTLF